MDKKRASWESSFGFILAASGSAVGLGNIWKFPYTAGVNGGSLFILCYLACILLLGLPIMLSEFAIGRHTQSNAINSFKLIEGKNNFWMLIGIFGVLASFIILSFYSVVAGWIFDYIFKAFSFSFKESTSSQIFSNLLKNPWYLVLLHFLFMSITATVVLLGVNKGIEKVSKILMPALFLILVFLLIYSFFLPGSNEALKFLFKPNLNNLNPKTFLEAMGQAFFTLSLGMGAMITYGSYLNKKENLLKSSLLIVIFDTLISIIAGIVVFSIVFSSKMEVASGPTLVFSTLPNLFGKMYMGNILALLFFLLLLFAALTSSISILEVPVAYCIDRFKWSRKLSCIIVSFLAFIVGIFCALSFNTLSDFKIPTKFIFNENLTFFDLMDKLSSNIMLPFGGLLISLYVAWKLDKKIFKEQLNNTKFFKFLIFLLKYIIPASISLVFFYGLSFMHPILKILGLM